MTAPLRDSLPRVGAKAYTLDEFADAVDQKITGASETDAVTPRWRTRVYVIGLIVAALVLVGSGLAGIFLGADAAVKVVAAGGVISSGWALISNGLGVAYRPTR